MKMQTSDYSVTNAALDNNNATNNLQTIHSSEQIHTWVVNYIANLLEIEPEKVDVKVPFDRYGLDSSAAVGLTGDLADWLRCDIDPTLLYDYPTIESLVKYLSSNLN
jgi:acyl carrier protein